jgi:hypothetical protein
MARTYKDGRWSHPPLFVTEEPRIMHEQERRQHERRHEIRVERRNVRHHLRRLVKRLEVAA